MIFIRGKLHCYKEALHIEWKYTEGDTEASRKKLGVRRHMIKLHSDHINRTTVYG
jgi:hypothetical protein